MVATAQEQENPETTEFRDGREIRPGRKSAWPCCFHSLWIAFWSSLTPGPVLVIFLCFDRGIVIAVIVSRGRRCRPERTAASGCVRASTNLQVDIFPRCLTGRYEAGRQNEQIDVRLPFG